jgi:hypothetical protein
MWTRDKTVHIDQLPIERHWAIALKLHELLGHTEPWELCEAGCDELASEAIRTVFGGGWAIPAGEQDDWNVRVSVAGITPSAGISSRYVDLHVGTVDWTPDMLLGDPQVEAMIETYRAQNATEMTVRFEMTL